VMTTTALALAAIEAHCRALRLPTIAGQCERLAEEAVRTQQSPLRGCWKIPWRAS
jgi:hypothetical protein